MRGIVIRIVVVAILLVPALVPTTQALQLSGIVVFSADAAGNPSGILTGAFSAQAWRTFVAPRVIWHGLAVLPGLPSEALDAEFLNASDFSIDVSLDHGEYHLTLLGEPGPFTWRDDYEAWVLNLYFDGNVAEPGISVVAPRYGDPSGSPPFANQAEPGNAVSFDLDLIDAPRPFEYDDGELRVTVTAFSLLPPTLAAVATDRVRAHSLEAGGAEDGVGVVTLRVERSSAHISDDGCTLTPSSAGPMPSLLLLIGPLFLRGFVLIRRKRTNQAGSCAVSSCHAARSAS